MKNPLTFVAAVLLASLWTTSAGAEGFAIGVTGGTLGLGPEMVASLGHKANLRVGASLFGNYSYSSEKSGVPYDLELELRSGLGVLDFHPTGGGFHLSAGAVYNKSTVDGVAQPSGTYTVGGVSYTGAEVGTLRLAARFERKLVPYVGLGFGNAVGEGKKLGLSLDLGVAFQGSPRVDLTTTGPISSDPEFQADLAREKAELDAELDDSRYKYYPVVALGLTYKL
jgi:hypothetical protein